jgi:hypothetical protein
MKDIIRLITIFTVVLFTFSSCGKTGETGPAGAAGANGEEGIDGADGTAGCVQCHSSDEDMQVKSAQWVNSVHVTGGHMTGFYGSADGCADCHSSQGFQEVVATGNWDNPGPDSPLPANCYTCHEIHETYTEADWAFRVSPDGIELRVNEHVTNQNDANTCVQCHQSRLAEPVLDLANLDTEVSIANKRYGPHHGPQGNMQAGVGNSGAYELEGDNYTNSAHSVNPISNCVSCHMASNEGSFGNLAMGEHSKNVGTGSWDDDNRSINANGCVTCHSELTNNGAATDFVSASRDANLALLDELRQKLIDMGYINESNYVINNDGETVSISDPLVIKTEHAAAIYNFKFVAEDNSAMIHNAKYARALVNNSIIALDN